MSGRSEHLFRFVVDPAHHGLRIDSFLASRLRNHAPAQLQRLAAAGLVWVDDVECRTDQRVHRGEEVAVRLADPPEPFYPPEPIPLEVLYDDPWLVAVNKPAGRILHPVGPVGDGTLANAVQALLDRQTRKPGLLRPGIVHRLDRETSGVVIVAKDHIAHASLTRQFERSAVKKSYVALVQGTMQDNEGVITAPIGQRRDSLLMSTSRDAISARPAETAYKVIERFRSSTLVEALPRTGRKHQIRVHFASIGHPVVGDVFYSGVTRSRAAATDVRQACEVSQRHALHAAAITFHHPVSNAPLRITAPVPHDFWMTLAN